MELDGELRDTERLGDLFVGMAVCDLAEYFSFPFTEGGTTFAWAQLGEHLRRDPRLEVGFTGVNGADRPRDFFQRHTLE